MVSGSAIALAEGIQQIPLCALSGYAFCSFCAFCCCRALIISGKHSCSNRRLAIMADARLLRRAAHRAVWRAGLSGTNGISRIVMAGCPRYLPHSRISFHLALLLRPAHGRAHFGFFILFVPATFSTLRTVPVSVGAPSMGGGPPHKRDAAYVKYGRHQRNGKRQNIA